jgi:hypothetical protein
MILFLALSSTVLAETPSFKDKALIPPDVAFLWNFQRGAEELYRFVKFTSTMRIEYSLELSERRIGEMEILTSKNKTVMIPTIENGYEMEIDKICTEMNTTDIFSKFTMNVDIKHNVTDRLQYDIDVLNLVSKSVPEPKKDYLVSAIKKTSDCIDAINRA